MTDFDTARYNMVESQIMTNKVTDPALIEAVRTIPREEFVPTNLRAIAYVDEDLPLGNDRYLMEPMILARLLQAAEIDEQDVVLDIGCATGYSTAVIARLCDTAVGLESEESSVEEANEVLTELDIGNAAVVTGDLKKGYPNQAPYDIIVISGAVESVPKVLGEQLNEGGRLVAVVRKAGGVGRATLYLKVGGYLAGRELFDAQTPYLPGFEPVESFVF